MVAELLWVIDRAEEHLGARARRPLPAQVLPLVPGAARGSEASRCGRAAAERRELDARPGAGRARSAAGAPAVAAVSGRDGADLPGRGLARAREARGVPRPPRSTSSRRGGREPAPAPAARLPLQLLRLAAAARARSASRRCSPSTSSASGSPRSRATTTTRSPGRPTWPRSWSRRHGDGRAGLHRRPRHGHLGRDRADGPRPRGRAGDEADAASLLFNGSMIQGAASPTLAQRMLRSPLGPLVLPALQRALLPRPVRLGLLARPSAHRRGGRGPVGLICARRRAHPRPQG